MPPLPHRRLDTVHRLAGAQGAMSFAATATNTLITVYLTLTYGVAVGTTAAVLSSLAMIVPPFAARHVNRRSSSRGRFRTGTTTFAVSNALAAVLVLAAAPLSVLLATVAVRGITFAYYRGGVKAEMRARSQHDRALSVGMLGNIAGATLATIIYGWLYAAQGPTVTAVAALVAMPAFLPILMLVYRSAQLSEPAGSTETNVVTSSHKLNPTARRAIAWATGATALQGALIVAVNPLVIEWYGPQWLGVVSVSHIVGLLATPSILTWLDHPSRRSWIPSEPGPKWLRCTVISCWAVTLLPWSLPLLALGMLGNSLAGHALQSRSEGVILDATDDPAHASTVHAAVGSGTHGLLAMAVPPLVAVIGFAAIAFTIAGAASIVGGASEVRTARS